MMARREEGRVSRQGGGAVVVAEEGGMASRRGAGEVAVEEEAMDEILLMLARRQGSDPVCVPSQAGGVGGREVSVCCGMRVVWAWVGRTPKE